MRGALDPFIRKLSHGATLTIEDRTFLEEAFCHSSQIEARQDLIREGDRPVNVYLVLDGLACRYKILPDGSRQIVALLLPGDLSELQIMLLHEMDHTIGTLTPCRVAQLGRTTVPELFKQSSAIATALCWATLVEQAVSREWLVGMGRRSADKQVAHLFCELLMRLQAAGIGSADGYDFPLSQTDLSDILGLTPVHVNRMLQQLRADRLISLAEKRLTIPDVPRLQAFAEFNPNYLHLRAR